MGERRGGEAGQSGCVESRSGDRERPSDALDARALRMARQGLDVDIGDRDRWLSEHCGQDSELRDRVQRLLARADAITRTVRAGGRGDATLGGLAVPDGRVGAYRLIECIGRGGMGEVWRGERCEGGFEQTVAIKLMLESRADWLRRFGRERQILARLNHPNIAHLVDGGVTGSGLSWLAMEFVEGETITRWCDRQRLGIEDRVRLMLPVCAAVQFAHQALVVHRDIKPANILVDAEGRPRLLDFGIAKLMDETASSEASTLIMTPAYAAPEQRSGEAITTATDVYQLGAVLFELLSGEPLEAPRARPGEEGLSQPGGSGPQDEAARKRRAGLRGTSPQRVAAVLNGDLGSILAKALAFQPGDRYGSARELADDLRNWLDNRPIRARRLGTAYRIRKFLRRNRLPVAVTGILAAALAVSLVFAWQWFQAERQQQLRSEKILGFMRELFSANHLEETEGQTLTVAELLDGAAERIDRQFADDPASRAVLLTELADVYRSLGRYEESLRLLDVALQLQRPWRAVAPDDYLQTLATVGYVRLELYGYEEAIGLAEEALALVGDDASAKAAHWRFIFKGILADALASSGHPAEAEPLYQDVLDASNDAHAPPRRRAIRRSDYAHMLLRIGRGPEAIEQFDIAERILLEDPSTSKVNLLVIQTSRALAHLTMGKPARAVEAYAQALPEMEQIFGEGHNRTTIVRSQMAQALMGIGRYRQALELVDHNLQFMEASGAVVEKDRVLVAKGVRPRLMIASLRAAEALPEIEEGMAWLQERTEGASFETAVLGSVHAAALVELGRFSEAREVLDRAYAEMRELRQLTADQFDPLMEDAVGRLALLEGQAREAAVHFTNALETYVAQVGEDSPRTARARVHLLWTELVQAPDRDRLEELERARQRLAVALEVPDAAPLWQVDLLIAEHAAHLGKSPPDPARVERSRQALREESGLDVLPPFKGISSI